MDLMSEGVKLCISYSWIFNCKMTDIFLNKPWLAASDSWLQILNNFSYSELRSLIICDVQPTWPQSLQDFCNAVDRYTVHCTSTYRDNIELPANICVGMSDKKRHEISHLASYIHKVCEINGCNLVADIGCGLGYLGQTLSEVCSLDVIGFELRESNCQGGRAKFRQSTEHSSHVAYQLSFDKSDDCREVVRQVIYKQTSESDNTADVCLVGLHCCGDLTPAMLYQFSKIEECKALVCMGCCYHRLTNSNGVFTNFPLSSKLKSVFSQHPDAHKIFNSYALRQACQETSSRWVSKTEEEHEQQIKSVTYRAVFEYCVQTKGYKSLTKRHKKLVSANSFKNFDVYVESLVKRLDGLDSNMEENFQKDMETCYTECESLFPILRWYTVLQFMIQGVLENILLQDRLEYIKELGIQADLVSVFDDYISPRNIAIVATR